MNKPDRPFNNDEAHLLAKLGGKYILAVHTRSQVISSIIGPIIGLYFVFAVSKLTLSQSIELILSVGVLITLTNLLHPVYTRIATRQAKARLDYIFKGIPLPSGNDPVQAWKEILSIPAGSAAAQVVSVLLIIIFPIVIFMQVIGGASLYQVSIIAVGGLLSELTIVIQSILYLDNHLAPARRVLLPSDPAQQAVHRGFSLAARQYFVIGFLILMTQLTAAILVYGKFIDAMAPGANLPAIMQQLQIQLGVIGAAGLVLGLFLASRSLQSITKPIQEMQRTIEAVQNGDVTERALIVSSDETAQLTIRMNQLLNQLQAYQTELERQIQERTTDLIRKTLYLQAASRVAHDSGEIQDINALLNRTVELISSRFGFYHTGIFLLDDTGENVVLQAASSEGGQRMLARGHKLEIGLQGIVGASAYQNKPRVVMDVDTDKDFYKNPDLPMTRSEVAIPLTARGNVLGILDIQSTEPGAFHQDDIDVLQTMADQIGLAIQNAQSLSESQTAVQRMEIATAENMQRIWRERIRNTNLAYRYTSTGIASKPEPIVAPVADKSDTSRLSIPIVLRGQRIGTITLHRKKDVDWTETDRSLAIEVSNQVGLALENARLLDEAQRRAAQEQSLSQLTVHLGSSLDPETILQTAVRELYRLPNVEEVSVFVTPQDSDSSTTTEIP
jgi:GAF domain-containing protein